MIKFTTLALKQEIKEEEKNKDKNNFALKISLR